MPCILGDDDDDDEGEGEGEGGLASDDSTVSDWSSMDGGEGGEEDAQGDGWGGFDDESDSESEVMVP